MPPPTPPCVGVERKNDEIYGSHDIAPYVRVNETTIPIIAHEREMRINKDMRIQYAFRRVNAILRNLITILRNTALAIAVGYCFKRYVNVHQARYFRYVLRYVIMVMPNSLRNTLTR